MRMFGPPRVAQKAGRVTTGAIVLVKAKPETEKSEVHWET